MRPARCKARDRQRQLRLTRERLHVDAPLRRVELEGLQRALLAEALGLVNVFIPAIVARARVALAAASSEKECAESGRATIQIPRLSGQTMRRELKKEGSRDAHSRNPRVFVRHDAAERIKDGARGEILRGNQHQAVALPLLLALHDRVELRICLR